VTIVCPPGGRIDLPAGLSAPLYMYRCAGETFVRDERLSDVRPIIISRLRPLFVVAFCGVCPAGTVLDNKIVSGSLVIAERV